MKALSRLIFKIGSTTSPWLTLVLIMMLNAAWLVILYALGKQFEQVAGLPPIDLQNTSALLSAPAALAQIMNYSSAAKTLYWVFFILDNLMPPLVFGTVALLWAYYLSRHRNRVFDRLRTSPFLLIPLGVGFFDWCENLCFVVVISEPTAANALALMELGLLFTRVKAGFLFTTFNLTFLLTGYHLLTLLYYRWSATRREPSSSGRL